MKLFGFLVMVTGVAAAWYGVNDIGLDNFGGLILVAVGGFVAVIGLLLLVGSKKALNYAGKATGLKFDFIKLFQVGGRGMRLRYGKSSAGMVFLVIILMVMIGLGYMYYTGQLGKLSIAPTTGGEETTKQVPLELPLQILVVNKLNGSTITNVNVRVIKDGRDYEPLSLSGNAYISTMEYRSGETIYLAITFPNNAFYIVPVTLPFYDKEIAEIKPPEYHKMIIKVPVPPSSLTVRLLDASGNSVASGSTINLTQLGVSTLKYTLMIVNDAQDTALFPDFKDPVTQRTYSNVVLVQVNGKPIVIDWDIAYTSGPTTKAYMAKLGDIAAVLDPKTQTVTPGTFTKTLTIDCSAMATGDTATITIGTYIDASIEYIKSYQVVNNEAIALASFSLTIVK